MFRWVNESSFSTRTPPLATVSRSAFSAAGFIATRTSAWSPGVVMSVDANWIWKAETPWTVPAGARISAGKSGSVARSLPSTAVAFVNRSPVSCIPSPESPANRTTTFSLASTAFVTPPMVSRDGTGPTGQGSGTDGRNPWRGPSAPGGRWSEHDRAKRGRTHRSRGCHAAAGPGPGAGHGGRARGRQPGAAPRDPPAVRRGRAQAPRGGLRSHLDRRRGAGRGPAGGRGRHRPEGRAPGRGRAALLARAGPGVPRSDLLPR